MKWCLKGVVSLGLPHVMTTRGFTRLTRLTEGLLLPAPCLFVARFALWTASSGFSGLIGKSHQCCRTCWLAMDIPIAPNHEPTIEPCHFWLHPGERPTNVKVDWPTLLVESYGVCTQNKAIATQRSLISARGYAKGRLWNSWKHNSTFMREPIGTVFGQCFPSGTTHMHRSRCRGSLRTWLNTRWRWVGF